MKLGDRVFVKDIKTFGHVADFDNFLGVDIYLDQIIKTPKSFIINGRIDENISLSKARVIIPDDIGITAICDKNTRLYKTNANNIRVCRTK